MGFALKLAGGFRKRRLTRRQIFARSKAGSVAVEFAFIGPVLLLMMTGIFSYGGYFLTAHTIQQITNDAARAALAGLDDAERSALARQSVSAGLASQGYMRGQISHLELARDETSLSVALTYDASEDLYWAFESLVPVPSPQISRRATIRLGGY